MALLQPKQNQSQVALVVVDPESRALRQLRKQELRALLDRVTQVDRVQAEPGFQAAVVELARLVATVSLELVVLVEPD
jgi:hypothetical protein